MVKNMREVSLIERQSVPVHSVHSPVTHLVRQFDIHVSLKETKHLNNHN